RRGIVAAGGAKTEGFAPDVVQIALQTMPVGLTEIDLKRVVVRVAGIGHPICCGSGLIRICLEEVDRVSGTSSGITSARGAGCEVCTHQMAEVRWGTVVVSRKLIGK